MVDSETFTTISRVPFTTFLAYYQILPFCLELSVDCIAFIDVFASGKGVTSERPEVYEHFLYQNEASCRHLARRNPRHQQLQLLF